MRNILQFVAVIMLTVFVIAGFWTSLLGADGMVVFWTTVLCAGTMALFARGSVLTTPWAIVIGIMIAGFLLGIPAKLVPVTNAGYGHLSQAGGLTLTEAHGIKNFALYSTVLFWLVYALIEAFKPKQQPPQQPNP